MNKYTSGPWHLREQGSEIEVRKGLYVIGMVHNYNDQSEENIANARLIAAAPDLLEALQSFPGVENINKDPFRFAAWIMRVDAAIIKATGEKEVLS